MAEVKRGKVEWFDKRRNRRFGKLREIDANGSPFGSELYYFCFKNLCCIERDGESLRFIPPVLKDLQERAVLPKRGDIILFVPDQRGHGHRARPWGFENSVSRHLHPSVSVF